MEEIFNELSQNLEVEEQKFVNELLETKYEPNKQYFDESVWKIVETALKLRQQVLTEKYKASEDRDERIKIAKELSEIVDKLKNKRNN